MKDNTGYDLAGAARAAARAPSASSPGCCSGVVARPATRAVVLLGLPGVQAALDVLAAMRVRVPRAAGRRVRRRRVPAPGPRGHRRARPAAPPAARPHLVLELAGGPQLVRRAADRRSTTPGSPRPRDRRRGRGRRRPAVRRLWRLPRPDHRVGRRVRGARTSSTSRCRPPALAEFVERCGALVRDWPTKHPATGRSPRPFFFGHLGDGNVHLNILDADPRRRRPSTTPSSRWSPSTTAASAPSTASAGPRRSLLPLNRTADEVAAMLAVKRALDPDGRLGRALLPFDGARRPV